MQQGDSARIKYQLKPGLKTIYKFVTKLLGNA